MHILVFHRLYLILLEPEIETYYPDEIKEQVNIIVNVFCFNISYKSNKIVNQESCMFLLSTQVENN